ncbi:MAG TPA: D-aminoacylase, partial [Gemmatimonadaceae bacterium]|nr:D-aminoacylase [Gemmatimonadaceae bacterium]
MIRLSLFALSLVMLACARSQGAQNAAPSRTVDILIRGGTVVDGSGGAPYAADVGIAGDRIAFVGDAARARVAGTRTIDARGLVVAPGFIDPHTHTLEDLSSVARHANVAYLMQGVTTVITGNDGGGPLDVAGTMRQWEERGIGTNAALYVGQGTVRRSVMGMADAAPTPEQMRAMEAAVVRAMEGGALGLSSGLYYAPGSYAATDEVIALARVAARYGGVYDSHLRDESSYTPGGLLGAVAEAIRIGRDGGLAVNISHVKALGADVWGRSDSVIALVRAARAAGQRVTADQYPYTASGSSVGASLLPRWAEVGGRDSLLWRMSDPATRARLVRDMEENLRRRGGADALLITRSRDTSLVGRRLGEVARARNVAPVAAALDILRAGDASVASFNMDERDIERLMREPWVMTGSDGSAGHPRKYGTFPRKLAVYVRERHVLSLPAAVRASSALAAETFGFRDRGHLREGRLADVIVFDEARVRDRATYEQPELLAEGMRWVLVNGTVAVEDGRYTGALAGRALRREPRREVRRQPPAGGLTAAPPLPYDAMADR